MDAHPELDVDETRPRRTARDVLSIWFRQRRLVGSTFAILASVTLVATWVQPLRYDARLKLLLRRDRVDAVVTANQEYQPPPPAEISEQELQSEANLLEPRDLLEEVVERCALDSGNRRFSFGRAWPWSDPPDGRAERDRIVADLERDLRVEVIKKSHVLVVTYRNRDAGRAGCVLNALSSAYVDKHLALKRPAEALDFFQREASGYRAALANAEARLVEFSRGAGVTAVELEKELVVRRLSESEATLRQTAESVAETEQRIRALEAQLDAVPPRQVTEVKTADPAQLMENLKSTLLTLQLKRTELLGRYAPEYRAVKEVEAQIADTTAAIEAAERAPLRDETTDTDPTYEWIRGEIAKATADLTALRARRIAVERTVRQYRREAQDLTEQAVRQQELLRTVKSDEENYLLYLRRQEEARISEALDRQHISNLVVAEPVYVPALPTSARWLVLVSGLALATIGSLVLGYVADAKSNSFRTPDELQRLLQVPVLATLPAPGEAVGWPPDAAERPGETSGHRAPPGGSPWAM